MNHADSTSLIISNAPQYFFDNLVIDQTQDLTKTVHSPEKEPEPLITKDRPWERFLYLTGVTWSVLRDSESGQFKCWYEDYGLDPVEIKLHNDIYYAHSRTCFAVSGDGLNWEKPELDYVTEDGRKTNVVFGDSSFAKLENCTVFEDLLETDPQKRFKMLTSRYMSGQELHDEALGMRRPGTNLKKALSDPGHYEIWTVMQYSSDGIEWTPYDEIPRFGRHGNGLGDVSTISRNTENGVYRMMTRATGMCDAYLDERRPITDSFIEPHVLHDVGRMNKRRIFSTESPDLIHWSRPHCIICPDPEEDNLDDSFYGMVQFKMGEMFVGMVNVLHEVSNTMNVRLVYSRDGMRWHFLNQRQPWLTTSPESWDKHMVNITSPPVHVDDQMYVYYAGTKAHHDWWMSGLLEDLDTPEARSMDGSSFGMGLAKMRRDGFVSIDAGQVREGILITRVLRTKGNQLELNVACKEGGYIQVEVTDADERPIEGFTKDCCDTFTGDSTRMTVTWGGNSCIPHNRNLRIRFFMRKASLYSFTMSPSPTK